jgi:phosphoketolase
VKPAMHERLADVCAHGEDLPEMRGWRWPYM